MGEQGKINTVEEYLSQYEGEVRAVLEKTRAVIRRSAPDAVEKISWQMPTYHQRENLIHFAAGKHHLGIYPGPEAVIAFADKLEGYKTSKGAIQFPYAKEIPYDLIEEITKYRVEKLSQ